MKKIIALILLWFMVLTFTACGTTSSQGGNSTNRDNDDSSFPSEFNPLESKILIAYFTWAENTVIEHPDSINIDVSTSASLVLGNTAIMARYIEEVTGGDLFSIVVRNPYPSDYNECLNRANREKNQNVRPKLKNTIDKMNEYDIIFLGYPNWWYSVPMAIYTFLESYDFSDKTIIPFCAHGTGGLASSVNDIRTSIPNAHVLEAIGIYRDDMSQAETLIKTWLNHLGFSERKEK